MNDKKFPIGKYQPPETITQDFILQSIHEIALLPSKLEKVVSKMNTLHYDQPYRPGSWTVRQVLYHIGDSHLSSYVRFKWALTEENPIIKAYDQDGWGSTHDSINSDVEDSMEFITILHKRWSALLKGLSKREWDRTFTHPEMKRQMTLKWTAGLYAWHGNHHLAHMKIVLEG